MARCAATPWHGERTPRISVEAPSGAYLRMLAPVTRTVRGRKESGPGRSVGSVGGWRAAWKRAAGDGMVGVEAGFLA